MCAQDFDSGDEYVPVYSNPKKRISEKTSDRRKRNKLWSLPEVVKLVNATALDRANAKDASLSIPKVFGFNDTMKLDQMLKDDSNQVDGVGKGFSLPLSLCVGVGVGVAICLCWIVVVLELELLSACVGVAIYF
ncbi:hypothetical protein Dimus_015906 [Dionaea muscipula]